MWLGKNTRSYIQLGRSIVLRLLLHPETTRENVWFWIGLENVPTEIGDMLGARLLRGFKIITVTDMVLRIDGLLRKWSYMFAWYVWEGGWILLKITLAHNCRDMEWNKLCGIHGNLRQFQWDLATSKHLILISAQHKSAPLQLDYLGKIVSDHAPPWRILWVFFLV